MTPLRPDGVTRVGIADDHPLMRRGIRMIIEDEPGLTVTGEAGSADEVRVLVRECPMDVLLLDIAMPGTKFLDLLAELQTTHPSVSVIAVTAYTEEQFAVRAFRAGVAGFVTKARTHTDLIVAIRVCSRGGRYVTPSLAPYLARALGRANQRTGLDGLSRREHQVLRGFGAGRTPTEVAAELGISVRTVSTYRRRLLDKLQLTTTAELIRFAVEHGLSW